MRLLLLTLLVGCASHPDPRVSVLEAQVKALQAQVNKPSFNGGLDCAQGCICDGMGHCSKLIPYHIEATDLTVPGQPDWQTLRAKIPPSMYMENNGFHPNTMENIEITPAIDCSKIDCAGLLKLPGRKSTLELRCDRGDCE